MDIKALVEKAKSETAEGASLRAAMNSGSKIKWVAELKAAFDADPQVIAWRAKAASLKQGATQAVASVTANVVKPEAAPATPKKGNRLLTIILIAAVILILGSIAVSFSGLFGGSPATSTPTSALPPGFGQPASTVDPFAFQLTATPLGPGGFGTTPQSPSTLVGKTAIVHYGSGAKPTNPSQPFADSSTYLDKHVGQPNSAVNANDPGFTNGMLGTIQQVQPGATEESGKPYSYDNGNPNNGDSSSACLFQPIDPASRQPIGGAAWVACGGLIIQP